MLALVLDYTLLAALLLLLDRDLLLVTEMVSILRYGGQCRVDCALGGQGASCGGGATLTL